jgi:hypothetical protein
MTKNQTYGISLLWDNAWRAMLLPLRMRFVSTGVSVLALLGCDMLRIHAGDSG